jgi:trimeric autotransporter adhesin
MIMTTRQVLYDVSGTPTSDAYLTWDPSAKSALIGASSVTGNGSIAIGGGTTVDGDNSIAAGYGCSVDNANSSGAFGSGCVVSDDFSFAFGQSSYCGDEARHSFACGENAGCEGAVSFAAGEDTRAPGLRSSAHNEGSFAVGIASFSTGGDTEANGDYSFASGKLANARRVTEYAHAGGSFTAGTAFSKTGLGESQYSRLVLLGSVDDSAQNQNQTVYMHLGGPSGATSIEVDDGASYFVTVEAVMSGSISGTRRTKAFILRFIVSRVGSTAVSQDSSAAFDDNAGNVPWTASVSGGSTSWSLTFNTSTGAARVTATVRWSEVHT